MSQIQAQMQSQMAVEQNKAVLDEKQSVSGDQRDMEIKERVELMKQGNVLHPTNLERHSVLLREQAQQQVQAEMQAEEQAAIAQQQQLEEAPQGPPPGLEEQGMVNSELPQ